MSLHPEENILTKEIESWKGCRQPQVRGGQESISYYVNDCQRYALAINAKETPFPTEPLIMAFPLTQHKMIKWLSGRIK